MKQSQKCKMAFKGRWLHNPEEIKYEKLKSQYERKNWIKEEKKRKLEIAEAKLEKLKYETQL